MNDWNLKWNPCATTAPEKSGDYLFATVANSDNHLIFCSTVGFSKLFADFVGAVRAWCVHDFHFEEDTHYCDRNDFAVDTDSCTHYWAEIPQEGELLK